MQNYVLEEFQGEFRTLGKGTVFIAVAQIEIHDRSHSVFM